MSTINTTPLVDVMLVLLIIFLITIPVINKTVKVDLPKAVNIPTQTKPENITIAVDKDGDIYWNDKRVADRNELLGLIEGGGGTQAAAGDAHPRRQGDALRGDRPGHVRDPARRHRQGRLPHRARPRRARLPLNFRSSIAMSMSVGTPAGDAMCDINTTPLIDVMLVLLVTLIVSLPIMTHAVKLDMPQRRINPPPPPDQPPEVIDLEIDFDGTVVWNGTPVASLEQLEGYFHTETGQGPAAGDPPAPRSARQVRRRGQGAGGRAAQPHEEDRLRQRGRIQGLTVN